MVIGWLRPTILLFVFLACSGAEPNAESAASASRTDINQSFKDPNAEAEQWVERFEVESREVYSLREALAGVVGLEAGERVADIGAGTGLFVALFADAVGQDGRVFAVDISPSLVEHMRERFADRPQVAIVHSEERSTKLLGASVDVVFSSDTYHHFTYYQDMLASIHQALAPGGRMLLVDFERVPGVSRDWLLEHVRASKEQVIREVEAAGFELDREVAVTGLVENYVLRFVKK